MRLYKILRSVYGGGADAREPTPEDLIAIMAAAVLDDPDDPRYALAAEPLRGNLTEIYRLYRDGRVPVVACTLVSNERDVAPFASAPAEKHLAPDLCEQWRSHFEKGMSLRETDRRAALAAFDQARELFDRHALLDYETARLQLAEDKATDAQRMFLSAVERDCMPWRAGPRFNEAVRAAAVDGGAVLADVFRALHEHIDGQPVGWRLMADHLHPSVEGQALMARTIAEAIAASDLVDGLSGRAKRRLRTLDAYRTELGDHPLVELATAVRVANFMAESSLGRNNADAIAALHARAGELLVGLDGMIQATVGEYVGPADEGRPPMPRNIALVVADDCLRQRNLDAAGRYYHVAAQAAEPYTFERLHAITGRLVVQRELRQPIPSEAIRAAIEEGEIVLEQTRRAGGEIFLARLWALAGDERRALDYARQHARGLADIARRQMDAEIRALLAGSGAPRKQGTAQTKPSAPASAALKGRQ